MLESLEYRRVLATVSWAVDADGFWDVASNWDTGTVPQAGDDVILDRPGGNFTITHRSGTSMVNTVTGNERLVVTGGVLDVEENIQLNNELLLSGGTIRNATILPGTGGDIFQVTSANGTLDGVTLAVDTTLLNGAIVTVLNDLMLDDVTLLLNRTDSLTTTASNVQLNFAGGAQTLGGTGVVEMRSAYAGTNALYYTRVQPTGGGSLTIGAGITVRNSTNSRNTLLGDGGLPLTIEGTVIAQSTQTTANTLFITGSPLANNGTLRATAGTLQASNLTNDAEVEVTGGALTLVGNWINNSTIDQSAGTINLGGTFQVDNLGTFTGTAGTVNIFGTLDDPGATLALNSDRIWQLNGGTIRGVTIADNDDGGAVATFRATSANGTLDGVTLAVDTTLLNGAIVTVLNDLMLDDVTLLLNRTDSLTTTASNVQLNFAGGAQTLGGTGVVEMRSAYAGTNALYYTRVQPTGGGSLTIGAGITVRNSTNSRNTLLGDGGLPLTIEGTVIAQSTQTTANTLFITGSPLTNNGTLRATAGTLQASNLTGNVNEAVLGGGTLDLNGNYAFNQPVNVATGTLTLRGTWTNNSTIEQSGGTINLGGTFQVDNLGTFTGTAGTVNIFGTLDDPGATLALNSDRIWQLNGGTIRGATIADNDDGGAVATFRATSANGTLDGVTLAVDTTLLNGAIVTVLNDLMLDDVTLLLNRTDSLTTTASNVQLNFAGGAQTLGGTGVVEMRSAYAGTNALYYTRVQPTGGGSLTIGAGITVRNSTNSRNTLLGNASLPLTIEGTVIAQSTQTTAKHPVR
jgi:hypothetical protein